MRLFQKLQLLLPIAKLSVPQSAELEEITKILESLPGKQELLGKILHDVTGKAERRKGREGLTADQILRLGILRKRNNMSYRDLSAATADSISVRKFLELGEGGSRRYPAI